MTVITGAENIRKVRLAAIKGAVKLEGLGLRHSSGRSMTALAKKILNLPRSTPREKVIEALEKEIQNGNS